MTTTPQEPGSGLSDDDMTTTGAVPDAMPADADGTDGDATDTTDGGDSDGTDGTDSDGTDGTDGDGTDGSAL
jgi:hypothetical protein